MNITNVKELPYFDRLPRFAMPALQAAWDRAHHHTVSDHAIYIGFCKDMEFIGYEKPTKPAMNEWIGKVEQGLIPRPLASEDDKIQEVVEAAQVQDITGLEEALSASIADEVPKQSDLTQPFFSPAFPAEIAPVEPMAKDLRAISTKMLDELVAEFEANARRHATSLIVGILRDLASEMERAA